MKVVVGVDGSEPSIRAVEWCAGRAAALAAEVVVVHVIDVAAYADERGCEVPPLSPEQDAALRDFITNNWCRALAAADASYRVEICEGAATVELMRAAERENADLVVTGRRGLGGFKELLLGSTSHTLSHHLGRPLLIIP